MYSLSDVLVSVTDKGDLYNITQKKKEARLMADGGSNFVKPQYAASKFLIMLIGYLISYLTSELAFTKVYLLDCCYLGIWL